MPTIISHAVVAVALISAFPKPAVPRRLALLGAICSMAPDADVLGFGFGIHYGDLLGHRGLSHSFLFAAVLSAALLFSSHEGRRGWVWLYLFLATASHCLLDALTNGGLGVAFFSPFDPTRYFFAFTPIAVSPIGAGFFSAQGAAALLSEFKWVWLPSLAFALTALAIRRFSAPCAASDKS
jgi:inner membrane protein